LHIILFEPAADGRLMFIRRFSDHRSELLEQQPQNGLASASVTAASDWTAAEAKRYAALAQLTVHSCLQTLRAGESAVAAVALPAQSMTLPKTGHP
jgi:hypothetical protein